MGEIEKNMLVQDINQVLEKYHCEAGIFCLVINQELIQFAMTKGNNDSTNHVIMQISAELNEIMQKANKQRLIKAVAP